MLDPRPARPETPKEALGCAPFDELRGADGDIRPHWRQYFDQLSTIGETEAKARWTKAKQLLAANGTSYNVYGDTEGGERPWRLSPLPLLIPARDWRLVVRGLAQRARLLSLLLGDLYGPQRCLAEGDLPCELVFENPRFLRAMHIAGATRTTWLPFYGADLIRGPSGQFHVLDDCTQAPSGMGYALENRIVVAHVLSDLLRHCNVERLVAFFRLLRERLREAAPHNRDDPRLALLTPGPGSPTYFEQAYLAKYLGISLVQGEDLTVRNDRVYLKTLSGLLPIDVLLRRVADDYCDPLELRPDSLLGVPGLVQAIRSGNVAAQNPLGTGLLETPALLAYLPGLCRRLLGEDLLLPSVPTYYCGDPPQLEAALAELDAMVVKPTHPVGHAEPTFVSQLEPEQRADLEREIRAAPARFVAQRFVPASKTPVIAEGELRTRACVLRCFANASQRGDYEFLPGGLGLVADSDTALVVSLHHGARSKDVWVLSEEPVHEATLAAVTREAVVLSRGGGDLPSRVADNLYWLGRYTERAEALGRLARVVGRRLLDTRSEHETTAPAELGLLLHALTSPASGAETLPATSNPSRTLADVEAAVIAAVTDVSDGSSLLGSIRAALRVGKLVRDRISQDTWRVLSSLDEVVANLTQIGARGGIPPLLEELDRLIIALAAFSGLVMESMTRGFAWRFLDMGRRLERAIHLTSLLREAFVTSCEREVPLVEAVLEVADSGMTYRRRYPAGYHRTPAVDLLLADETNPRSVIFQVRTLGEHFAALPPLSTSGVRSVQQRLVLTATSHIELSDIHALSLPDERSRQCDGLQALLAQLAVTLPALSDSLTETYLYHADVPRHLRQGGVRPGAPLRGSDAP